MFDALLFDMDGLLLDTERVARDTFVALVTAHGVAADDAEAFFLTLVGTSSAETSRRVQAFLPQMDKAAFDAAWTDGFRAKISQAVPVMPQARAILAQLADRGHRMAVVTSSHKAHALENLGAAGLLGHFEHVVGGDEVTANKPDPAPYLQAAALMGVDPKRCAAFEDSDRGLTAAMRAGCRAVQIPDLRPPDLPLPALGQLGARDLKEAMAALGLLDRT